MFSTSASSENSSDLNDSQLDYQLSFDDLDFSATNQPSSDECSLENALDVVIFYTPENAKEYIPNLPATLLSNGDIDLHSLIKSLQSIGIISSAESARKAYYYYSQTAGMYIHCGQNPLPETLALPNRDIISQQHRNIISLKIKSFEEPSFKLETSDANLDTSAEMESTNNELRSEKDFGFNERGYTKITRTNERKISEALELVLKWRKLTTGVRDSTGGVIQLSLEDAAKKLGVAKKALDDYLLQISEAKTLGFDFQANHNQRISVMRTFVRKLRAMNKNQDKENEQDSKKIMKCKSTKRIKKTIA